MNQLYDIIVAGGGLAGTFAAVAAARMGKNVLLVEKEGYLGGSLTSCGVGPMMTAYAGERQIIAGLFQEMVKRMEEKGGTCGHIRDTTGYISYLTPFSAEKMKLVLDEMTTHDNCHVLFHTQIAQVEAAPQNRRIISVTLCNKDGLSKEKAGVYIDATGDGDLAYMAGAPVHRGRLRDGLSQPMTMNMKYYLVDRETLKQYVLEHLEEFPRMKDNRSLIEESKHLSIAGFSKEMETARRRREITFSREELLIFETDTQGEFIVNTTRIIGKDSTSAWELSESEREGRRQCQELDLFLKKYIPGFANAHLIQTGPNIGVRGSRQLAGCYELEEEDILEGRMFDSRIALAAYPVDIHNPDGSGTDSRFQMGSKGYYSIPFEVMYCQEYSNLLVTGRCVSASFEAQAAIRTTPTTAAMGQAAGTAAALTLDEGTNPTDLDRNLLRLALLAGGAIL